MRGNKNGKNETRARKDNRKNEERKEEGKKKREI